MEITNITIVNIKRYGTTHNSLSVSLKSNKYNLLVAPNGFGKSSLAKALESLTPNGIVLKKELFHSCDDTLNPEIKITVDGQEYKANKRYNDISPIIEPFVINSGLYAKGYAQRFAMAYNPQGYMQIEDVVIKRLIPKKSNYKYSYNSEKTNFGTHGKLMINMKYLFANAKFCSDLRIIYNELDLYTTKSSAHRDKLYGDIRLVIQGLSGTKSQILANIPQNLLDDIEQEENYAKISALLSDYGLTSSLDRYMAFYQIRHMYANNKPDFKKMCERAAFDLYKEKQLKTIRELESPAFPIALVENKKRELVVTFPDAENISNGQRDLMSLVANLLKFEAIIAPHKNYFLIIDEVFDYLDDANFIAAQYYLSRILKGRNNVIITILTHLDPRYFRMSTVFSPKKLNLQFMMNIPNMADNTLKQLVVFRQGLDKQCQLYKDISTYQFHYSPTDKEFYGNPDFNLALESLSSTGKLKNYVAEEISKYFNGQTFDPIAVCLGIRYKSEKDMYEKIDIEQQAAFLSKKGTRKRLEFAENLLGNIDDKYYILSVLHNEINHLSNVNEERMCVYQLENLTIKQMIFSLFGKNNIQSEDI